MGGEGKKSSMFRSDNVALTTTKVSGNMRSVTEGSGDHSMIRGSEGPSEAVIPYVQIVEAGTVA